MSGAVLAHFKLNLNIRVIHVDHQADALYVYMRLPMPYLVADLAGAVQEDGSREPAPYTSNALVDGEWMHYVDFDAIQRDPAGLGELAASGHAVTSGRSGFQSEVKAVRVYPGISQPPFSTLEEAELAFQSGEPWKGRKTPLI